MGVVRKMLENNYNIKSDWCLGCGNFGIMAGLKKAADELNLSEKELVLVSGVGCYAKLPYWVNCRGFVGLHGRELAVGQGIKMVDEKVKVVVLSGDGAGYGEGGNHFLHTCRRNIDLVYLVHNNGVFGLTTGQYSPTAEKGRKSKSSPLGSVEEPINPLALAIVAGAELVARAYANDINQLAEIIKKAISYPGFAFIDVVQPCVSFGRDEKDKIYYLGEEFDRFNKLKALEKAIEQDGRIACGIIYEVKK